MDDVEARLDAADPLDVLARSSVAEDTDRESSNMDRETGGLTVGDGFRFGCGFVLSTTIGILALLIILTVFVAVGALLGVKIPVLG